jgi:pimeloyl-ACP methyl ester carboxylesterase
MYIAVVLSLVSATSAADGFELQTEDLNGVPCAMAVPAEWNGRLLLLARGSQPPGTPLFAEHEFEDAVFRTLLDEGWLIAFTAYRQDGPVLNGAVGDLLALRDRVAGKHGEPEIVLVEGRSLGAVVATLLVERHPGAVDGACAFSPLYSLSAPGEKLSFSRRPERPLLLLSNLGESTDARAYLETAEETRAPVAFWQVKRYGHVNVNAAERLEVLRALSDWAEHGAKPEPRELLVAMNPESVAARDEDVISANVLSVDPVHGNVETAFVPGDLAWLDVAERGLVWIVSDGGSTGALYGKSYSSTPPGRGVIFPNAEGRLTIAVNRGSAVERLGCDVGDILTVRPWDGTGVGTDRP